MRLVVKHDCALVLVDVQMPEMDGFELAEFIRGRQATRHLPIIVVTAISQEPQYVFKGYEAGAVDYLFKPIDPEILRSKVKVFLELYGQQQLLTKQAAEHERKKSEEEIKYLAYHDVLSGDEFTILLNDLNDDTNVAEVAEKIRAVVAQPYRIKSHELYVAVSIGISVYPEDGEHVETPW